MTDSGKSVEQEAKSEIAPIGTSVKIGISDADGDVSNEYGLKLKEIKNVLVTYYS